MRTSPAGSRIAAGTSSSLRSSREDLRGNSLRRFTGVGRGNDRAPDHDIAGTVADRLAGGHRALLIVSAPGRRSTAYPRRHHHELAAARAADDPDLLR